MNFQETYETIIESGIFKRFINENKDAELVAGFFILDLLENKNQRSLDYKADGRIFTFSIDENDEIALREDELIKSGRPLKKISPNIELDLDEIPSLAEELALDNNVKNRFQKIIAVLQLYDEKEIWNLTCMLDSLIILNILIDAKTRKTIKFDKKSIADFVKKK